MMMLLVAWHPTVVVHFDLFLAALLAFLSLATSRQHGHGVVESGLGGYRKFDFSDTEDDLSLIDNHLTLVDSAEHQLLLLQQDFHQLAFDVNHIHFYIIAFVSFLCHPSIHLSHGMSLLFDRLQQMLQLGIQSALLPRMCHIDAPILHGRLLVVRANLIFNIPDLRLHLLNISLNQLLLLVQRILLHGQALQVFLHDLDLVTVLDQLARAVVGQYAV
mmetsp:Transcript_32438/g.54694  ORF Transcript_32438/g.54694 Transcript_32438/m.54694 type:complete len:217 (-) Transcript_32438:2533-3183(-)